MGFLGFISFGTLCSSWTWISVSFPRIRFITHYFFSFFLIYLLIMLLQLSHFRPFTQLHPVHPLPPIFPPYSSCPWVILISSLASTFPTLFLPSPCLFSTIIYAIYSLYLSPLSPPPNPLLITLHVISISVVLFLF